MIARRDGHPVNVWERLPITLHTDTLDQAAEVARRHLDAIVPGEWDFTLDVLPYDGMPTFKARLQILGIIREAIGTGDSYVTASQAAFIGTARRFGLAVVVGEGV